MNFKQLYLVTLAIASRIGCNQSKKDDISRDRERRARPSRGGGRSSPIGIGGLKTADEPGVGGILSTSTDARLMEHEFRQRIVTRADRNLIDVKESGMMDEEEISEYAQEYEGLLDRAVFENGALSQLYTVPTFSAASTEGGEKTSVDDRKAALDVASSVHTSLTSMSVDASGLVVPFGEKSD